MMNRVEIQKDESNFGSMIQLGKEEDYVVVFVQRSRRAPWTSISKCVCLCVTNFQASDWSKYGDVARRRQASYDVARLLLMVPIEPWRNSIPIFGAAAFCTTKIDDNRTLKYFWITIFFQPNFFMDLYFFDPIFFGTQDVQTQFVL